MNKKILKITEVLSNERCLPKEKIFETLETALTIATKKKYEQQADIKVKINRNNGTFYTYRKWLVVKKVKKPQKEINFKKINNNIKNIKIGDYIENKIESIIFDRITTQITKQIILQKIREAEKLVIIKQLEKKKEFIINGIIKKINKNNIIVDIGSNLEGLINKKNIIYPKKIKLGNRIKSTIYKIIKNKKKYQILLSRSRKEMLKALLKKEIPEINKKIIEIKAIVRNPGLRSKVAVKSKNKNIDPIGACIGIKGSRIQSISNELYGERIDIILWDKNPKQFVINAMSPAEILNISVNKKKRVMNVLVKFNKLAKAIGKNGLNIKLASKLTGWEINVLTPSNN